MFVGGEGGRRLALCIGVCKGGGAWVFRCVVLGGGGRGGGPVTDHTPLTRPLLPHCRVVTFYGPQRGEVRDVLRTWRRNVHVAVRSGQLSKVRAGQRGGWVREVWAGQVRVRVDGLATSLVAK